MEPELRELDFDPEPIECFIKRCDKQAQFIVKFQPHPHDTHRWYPVCVDHAKTTADSPCERCLGKRFPREAIETL